MPSAGKTDLSKVGGEQGRRCGIRRNYGCVEGGRRGSPRRVWHIFGGVAGGVRGPQSPHRREDSDRRLEAGQIQAGQGIARFVELTPPLDVDRGPRAAYPRGADPRAISSAGRASRLHRGGRGFESLIAHQPWRPRLVNPSKITTEGRTGCTARTCSGACLHHAQSGASIAATRPGRRLTPLGAPRGRSVAAVAPRGRSSVG